MIPIEEVNLFAVLGRSQDRSREILENGEVKFVDQVFGGKGEAVKTAFQKFLESDSTLFAMFDADGTIRYSDINYGLNKISNDPSVDVLIGNRFTSTLTRSKMPLTTKYVNSFLSTIIALWFKKNPRLLPDVQSPVWIIRKNIIKDMVKAPLKSKYFDIEAEMVIFLLSRDAAIQQYPISYDQRIGKSKFNFRLKLWNLFIIPKLLFNYSNFKQKVMFMAIILLMLSLIWKIV